MRNRLVLYSLLMMSTLLLLSCGEDEVCAPPLSVLSIAPTSVDIVDGGASSQVHTHFFTITMTDSQLRPIKGAKLSISYQWAVPDAYSLVQLYDDETTVDSPFNAETDEFGVYYLRVDFISGGGATYEGDIEVRSCGFFNSSAFSVAAESTGGA